MGGTEAKFHEKKDISALQPVMDAVVEQVRSLFLTEKYPIRTGFFYQIVIENRSASQSRLLS
jgi:hypothetical protein